MKNNTLTSRLSPFAPCRGITLMECLASVFVIGIGLLGVLAVIPYGSFQISKGKQAENAAWMLVNSAENIKAMKLTKPKEWVNTIPDVQATDNTNIIFHLGTDDSNTWLNCSRILMLDASPFNANIVPGNDVFRIKIGANGITTVPLKVLFNRMTYPDDIVYTTYASDTGKRPDFAGQNNKIQSSGKYSCFITFKPKYKDCKDPSHTHGNTSVPFTELEDTTAVDILGCCNRGGEDFTPITPVLTETGTNFIPIHNGMQVTLPSIPGVELKNIKYVLLTWQKGTDYIGGWYKLVNVFDTAGGKPQLLLTFAGGESYDYSVTTPPPFEILFIEGTMYYKRMEGGEIR